MIRHLLIDTVIAISLALLSIEVLDSGEIIDQMPTCPLASPVAALLGLSMPVALAVSRPQASGDDIALALSSKIGGTMKPKDMHVERRALRPRGTHFIGKFLARAEASERKPLAKSSFNGGDDAKR